MLEANTTGKGVGVQVDWIDREIGKVLKAQDRHQLAQNASQMRQHIEGVRRQPDIMEGELKQLEEEMSGQGMGPTSS